MKKLIWVMTVALTVCAFTVWSYAAVSISSGRHIYIPILYILTWGGLVYLGVRSKTRTPLIASLVYWIMVIAVSATALIASSGIAETFLYKYLTAPAAFAFMPFFGFIDSGSENINAFCVAVITISAVFAAVCIFFTARLFRVRSRVILMSMSPFVLTLAGSLCLFDPFAEAFIGYLNGRAQVGAENTMLILSVIYVLGWASILVLAAYRSASRLVCILERIVRFVDMVCRLLQKRGDNIVAHTFAALRFLPEKRLSRIVCGRVCGDLRRTASFIILYIQKIERKAHWIYNETVKESKHQRKALQ